MVTATKRMDAGIVRKRSPQSYYKKIQQYAATIMQQICSKNAIKRPSRFLSPVLASCMFVRLDSLFRDEVLWCGVSVCSRCSPCPLELLCKPSDAMTGTHSNPVVVFFFPLLRVNYPSDQRSLLLISIFAANDQVASPRFA